MEMSCREIYLGHLSWVARSKHIYVVQGEITFLIALLEIAGFFLSFFLTYYSAPIRLMKEDIKPRLYIKSAILIMCIIDLAIQF